MIEIEMSIQDLNNISWQIAASDNPIIWRTFNIPKAMIKEFISSVTIILLVTGFAHAPHGCLVPPLGCCCLDHGREPNGS